MSLKFRALGGAPAGAKRLAEIGAGTGSFTQALLDAGLPKSQLVPIELDQNLFLYLQKRFPGLSPICGDARDLHNLLPPDKKEKLCAVVSGIPMITMPEAVQTDIINSAFALLKSEGLLYQFTYSPVSSIPAERFGLEKQRLGTVFMNVPPATVWCYRQTKASRKQ